MNLKRKTFKVAEIMSMCIALLSLILNAAIIYIVINIRRESHTKKRVLGLKLVLIVAIFDLLGPIVGAVQEIISVESRRNIMLDHSTCQILGIFHTLLPYTSSNLVALVSLEKFFNVHDNPIRPRSLTLLGLAHFLPAGILAILTAWYGQFEASESRLICFISPRKGMLGYLFFIWFIIMLVVNMSVILVCYLSIIRLRYHSKGILSINVANRSDAIPGTILDDNRASDSSELKILVPHQKSDSSDQTGDSHPNTIPHHRHSLPPPKPNSFLKTHSLAIRATLIMVSYSTIFLPCITILIYDVSSNRNLHFLPSTLYVILLFSFTIVNPLLLILLHSNISTRFMRGIRALPHCPSQL